MPLEEVSFTNMVGEEVNITNIVTQMIDYYQQKLEIGETKVTDFNEGSEIRNILDAVAVLGFAVLEDENEATKLPFISSSYGVFLDKIGENPFINLPRITGGYSTGNVTFSINDVQESDIIIPADTLLENGDNLQFVTDADCTIYAGETTGDVSATCLTTGYDGNIGANTLTIMDTDIDSDLINISNEEFIDGADEEGDEEYRTRLLENVQSEGFGTTQYYDKLGESVTGVHDVLMVSDATYTRKVLINGFSKPTPDDVLLDVLAEYSDVNNIVLGHSFTIDKPTYSSINLTFTLDMTTEWTTTDLTSFVTAAINGGSFNQIIFDGLNIGENLTHQFLENAFSLLDDVVDMSVKVTGQSSEFVSTDISYNAVVKLGTLTFNQTVV